MNPRLTVGLLGLCLLPSAHAGDWRWVPHAHLASRHFEYTAGSGNIKGEIYSLGIGATVIYQRYYLDFGMERNLEPGQETSSAQLFPESVTELVEFDREDTTLAVGYGVSDLTSVFAGFKQGKTTITATGDSPFAGNSISLSGTGPFIGAGAGWKVRDWGIASFSAAYASLDAEYESPVETQEARASGTSLGVNWRGMVGKSWEYRIAMTRHDYDYNSFENGDGEISENILSYSIGVAYRF